LKSASRFVYLWSCKLLLGTDFANIHSMKMS
jgi:hypothetical protein